MASRVQRVLSAAGAGYVLITTWLDLYARPEGEAYYDNDAHDAARDAHAAAIVAALRERGVTAPCLCLLYTSPSPRDRTRSRMPSSA